MNCLNGHVSEVFRNSIGCSRDVAHVLKLLNLTMCTECDRVSHF